MTITGGAEFISNKTTDAYGGAIYNGNSAAILN
jgi:predicted outer membrane repeat protein